MKAFSIPHIEIRSFLAETELSLEKEAITAFVRLISPFTAEFLVSTSPLNQVLRNYL